MFFRKNQCVLLTVFAAALNIALLAQQPLPLSGQPPAQNPQAQNPQSNPNQPQAPGLAPRDIPSDSVRPNYVLGPNDQVLVRSPGAEEINEKPFRIDADGNINMPLLGRVRAGGMTV